MGNMSHWECVGNWAVGSGGYGTETLFQTSHMTCEKSQNINLQVHFSAEYLDTAPDIQVACYMQSSL